MQGTIRTEAIYSETLAGEIRYHIYLPAGYAEIDATYPALYLLHGRGGSMDDWLTIRETLDGMIASGNVPPLLAVMPDAPYSSAASYYVDSEYETGQRVETAFVTELLPHIDATYRTDTDRSARVVGGYSMGGYGAIRYALAYPELFGGAIILSPAVYTPLPPEDSSTRAYGAFGSGTTLFDPATYQRLNYPPLLETVKASDFTSYLFIVVGDHESKHPAPEDALHDLDMEAHLFYNRASRVPNLHSEFRVYGGGHDWTVWERGLVEGSTYIFSHLRR